MIEVLSKNAMSALTTEDLDSRIFAADNYVLTLVKKYGYSELQWDCVRSSASGEMGNMFVIMRRHNIDSSTWRKTLEDMKAANAENYTHFYESVRAAWKISGEKNRRFWSSWVEKQKAKHSS